MSATSWISGSGSNVWAALSTHAPTTRQKVFAKVDTDDNGSVNQAELSTLLDKVSEKSGASFGDAAKDLMQSQASTSDFAQARKSGSESDAFAKKSVGPGVASDCCHQQHDNHQFVQPML